MLITSCILTMSSFTDQMCFHHYMLYTKNHPHPYALRKLYPWLSWKKKNKGTSIHVKLPLQHLLQFTYRRWTSSFDHHKYEIGQFRFKTNL